MLEKNPNEEPFLKIHDDSPRNSLDFVHQQLALEKRFKRVWLLKWSLVVLYIPAIILFVWSYLRWSNFQHPRPLKHYICPEMIPCKSEIQPLLSERNAHGG